MIKPLYDNVVLEEVKETSETKSGILLSTKEENSPYAKVVEIGNGIMPDKTKVEMPIDVGDKVLYTGYSNKTYEENGKKYIIVKASDIIAIIK